MSRMKTLGVRLTEEQLLRLQAVFDAEKREHLPGYAARGEVVRRLLAGALDLYEAGGWELLERDTEKILDKTERSD